jgi:membrane-bound inhibitor of C-type lysozyme
MRVVFAIAGAVLMLGTIVSAPAEDLTVRLPGVAVTRIRASFECGIEGVTMGLPAGSFTVQYLNAGENHLALLPMHGQTLIFTNVVSGSGARYAAGRYIWWDAGDRGVTLSIDGDGRQQANCHLVKKR